MINDFAESVVHRVHAVWESHATDYPAGYAVFYGPVRYMPNLLLIGLNPGGDRDQSCFNGKKEVLHAVDEPMEYLKYRHDFTYPIAGRTANIFESAGLLDLLATSVKTNLIFFRSKKYSDLSMPRPIRRECLDLVMEIIKTLKPKAILCESLSVFDILHNELQYFARFSPLSRHLNSRNRRIYISITQCDLSLPSTIIGITHLTGSRPSKADIELIGHALTKDLYSTNAHEITVS